MKKTFSICLMSLFLFSLIASPGLCQDAKKILEKMIEAQGGRDHLAKVKDSSMSGSMELTQMGMSGTISMHSKEPNKMRMDIEVMGMIITQATDGETAWQINPQTGSVEDMTEQQAQEFNRQAIGNASLLNPEKYGITYTYKETEKIEDKDYFVLEQTFADGFKATLWIDSKTYLHHKTKALSTNQMGVEVDTETFLSDYKKVEEMMFPQSITIYQDGEEFLTMTVTEVKFNTGLEDSFFQKSE